jgi:hypothetical protein
VHLQGFIAEDQHPVVVREMAQIMQEKLVETHQPYCTLLHVDALLDSRYRHFGRAHKEFLVILVRHRMEEAEDGKALPAAARLGPGALRPDLGEAGDPDDIASQARLEVDRYFSWRIPDDERDDPLKWWKKHHETFPNIAWWAKHISTSWPFKLALRHQSESLVSWGTLFAAGGAAQHGHWQSSPTHNYTHELPCVHAYCGP